MNHGVWIRNGWQLAGVMIAVFSIVIGTSYRYIRDAWRARRIDL